MFETEAQPLNTETLKRKAVLKCDLCDRTFQRRQNLEKHLKRGVHKMAAEKQHDDLVNQIVQLKNDMPDDNLKKTLEITSPFLQKNDPEKIVDLSHTKKECLRKELTTEKSSYDKVVLNSSADEKDFFRSLSRKTRSADIDGTPIAVPVVNGEESNEGSYYICDARLEEMIGEYENRLIGLKYEVKRRGKEKQVEACDFLIDNYQRDLREPMTQEADDSYGSP